MEINSKNTFYSIFLIILLSDIADSAEFTFDLADNDEQCFYEVVPNNIPCKLEFQVVSGGQLDVDVTVEAPNQNLIYKELRKEYDTFMFNTTEAGEFAICFSNQFSTFTHKSIFMSFVADEKNQLFEGSNHDIHDTVMTFMETTAEEIHDTLNDVINGQMHYRLQESHGRRFAEELNERVLGWSLMQTFVIVAISVSQVLILRNFFNEPRSVKPLIHTREPRFGYVH
ncbi:transmembrane emp24 domain-containing protein 3-like [Contarinia nasturtii]|uniref:transmembrane emp24 domain-containing protein 3-like n=1 Tax=Contarinia nasturtii TaxID=265458 RepID=UPI0012D45CE3|nr:transmembrane emp24 domain-containing protein 3-like [Contarinia nasturtii]